MTNLCMGWAVTQKPFSPWILYSMSVDLIFLSLLYDFFSPAHACKFFVWLPFCLSSAQHPLLFHPFSLLSICFAWAAWKISLLPICPRIALWPPLFLAISWPVGPFFSSWKDGTPVVTSPSVCRSAGVWELRSDTVPPARGLHSLGTPLQLCADLLMEVPPHL